MPLIKKMGCPPPPHRSGVRDRPPPPPAAQVVALRNILGGSLNTVDDVLKVLCGLRRSSPPQAAPGAETPGPVLGTPGQQMRGGANAGATKRPESWVCGGFGISDPPVTSKHQMRLSSRLAPGPKTNPQRGCPLWDSAKTPFVFRREILTSMSILKEASSPSLRHWGDPLRAHITPPGEGCNPQ